MGQHGLILIREGDWNDYLSLMGVEGRGESVMNSGMACRAFSALSELAVRRGETPFAEEVVTYVAKMRLAVADAFDQGWFRRGYTDHGKPVGSYAENRLFINAQAWPILGKCGTPEQRRIALKNAIELCHTDIGLTLMSRPYSSPAPDDISWCSIPAGEGENAGIWPQTIHWLIWALTEEGLLDKALAEWKCGTLHRPRTSVPQGALWHFQRAGLFLLQMGGQARGLDAKPIAQPRAERADESDDCVAGIYHAQNHRGADPLSWRSRNGDFFPRLNAVTLGRVRSFSCRRALAVFPFERHFIEVAFFVIVGDSVILPQNEGSRGVPVNAHVELKDGIVGAMRQWLGQGQKRVVANENGNLVQRRRGRSFPARP